MQGAAFNTVADAFAAVDAQVITNTGDIANLDGRVATNTTDIANLDGRVTTNTTDIADLRSDVANGTIGLVQQDPATGAISVGAQTGGGLVDLAGTDGNRVLSGIAAGVNGNDAVNLAQLNAAMSISMGDLPIAGNKTSGLAGPSATGTDSLAAGFGAQATGAGASGFGSGAVASGSDSVALGAASLASAAGAVALGQGAQATSLQAVAIGQGAVASGSTAVGGGAQATGASSAAFGMNAVASGDRATAIGENSLASGANSTAVGEGAQATHANAVAIGAGARTSRANQVVLGGGGNYTYTLPGMASPASRAAQSGPLQVVTTDGAGNLAGDGGALYRHLDEVHEEARQGIAAAMAMSAAPMPSAPGRTSWTANLAAFRGEAAFGAALAHRFDAPVPLALTAGYAYGGNDSHGARIGLVGEF